MRKCIFKRTDPIPKEVKVIYVDRSQKISFGGRKVAIDAEGEGIFWGDGNVLYLDLGGSYMVEGICKNPPNSTLHICTLYCM